MADMTRGGIGQDRPERGGDMRVGAIIAVPSLLAERGLDPVRVFAAVGLDPCLLDDPENRISFQELGRLFAACADATGCPHFGLMAVERYGPDSLGAVGHQMRNSPTVGEALRNVQLHLHLNDRGAVLFLLHLDPERVALCYTIFWHDTHVTSLIYDAALAVAHKALRELCGPSWKALGVQLARRGPAEALPYKRFFGVRPEFDAERCAIVFASSWLSQPVAGADPVSRDRLERAIIDQEVSEPDNLATQVRRVLYPMVLSGTATLASTARLFSLHERTLRRRLDADGTTFHQLLNEARFEVAQQLLSDTRLPAAEIAAILGYSNPGAFSRAFRVWSGSAPKRWRDRRAGSGHLDR
jgi:AraC-like DNA-binding protein